MVLSKRNKWIDYNKLELKLVKWNTIERIERTNKTSNEAGKLYIRWWYINILVARDIISHYDTQRHMARLCIYHSDDVTLVFNDIKNMSVVLALINDYTSSMWRHNKLWYYFVTPLSNS